MYEQTYRPQKMYGYYGLRQTIKHFDRHRQDNTETDLYTVYYLKS